MQDEKKTLSTAGKVRSSGKVLPQEPVDIYAGDSKSGKHLGPVGTKHSVHAVLADKLVEKGAATLTEPAVKPKKEVKLTKAEITALEKELGREPNEDELAEALNTKINEGTI